MVKPIDKTKCLILMPKKRDLSTEEKILQAAHQEFTKTGFSGARMQDIADQAGINKAMLHYYFRSKQKLFEVIFTEAFSLFIPKAREIFADDHTSFEHKIRMYVGHYIDLLMKHPYLPNFILNEMHAGNAGFIDNIVTQLPLKEFGESLNKDIGKRQVKKINPVDLFLNMVALCVFPFIARPVFQKLSKLSNKQYDEMLIKRKQEVTEIILKSIKS